MKRNQMLEIAVRALASKKAVELQAVEVTDITVLADYFLFVSGTSSTHIKTLAEETEFQLEQAGVRPHHIEGRATGWILLDYGSLVIHVFQQEQRQFYGLDKLWADGKPVDLTPWLD